MGVAVKAAAVLVGLLLVLGTLQWCRRVMPPTGPMTVNTFEFVRTAPPAAGGGPTPHVWIDANTAVSFSESTVTSSLPCAVMIDYTDNSEEFGALVFSVVKVTYDDGTVDPGAAGLKLPLRIKAREYETVNSMAGGRIVRSKVQILSGSIPGVVTRAEAFTLRLEGHFEKKDGERVAFTIDEHFDVKTERGVRNAADVLQDK